MATQSKCTKCSNDFLVITKEEEFYREKDLPLPTLCPNCRLERRMNLRDKKELLGYNCDKCGKDIITAVEPEEGLEIYCKQCYQAFMQEHDCILGTSDAAKSEGITNQPSPQATPVQSATTNNDPVSW